MVGILITGAYSVMNGLLIIAGTLLLSVALYVSVDISVDRWRQPL